jgi:hypothetical protein
MLRKYYIQVVDSGPAQIPPERRNRQNRSDDDTGSMPRRRLFLSATIRHLLDDLVTLASLA